MDWHGADFNEKSVPEQLRQVSSATYGRTAKRLAGVDGDGMAIFVQHGSIQLHRVYPTCRPVSELQPKVSPSFSASKTTYLMHGCMCLAYCISSASAGTRWQTIQLLHSHHSNKLHTFNTSRLRHSPLAHYMKSTVPCLHATIAARRSVIMQFFAMCNHLRELARWHLL